MGKVRIAGKERGNPYADVQVELTAMIFDRVLPTIMTGGVIMVVATLPLPSIITIRGCGGSP